MVDRDRYLAEIADHLPNGFFYQLRASGTEREFLFCSRGVERVFGVTPDDARLDASLIYGRIRPEFADRVATAEAKSIASGEPFFLEMPIMGPKGRGWVQVSSAKRVRSDGLEVWEGVVLDITDVKSAEAERAEAERRLELATTAAEIGIWHWDILTGEFLYSPRARAIYGFTTDEPITFEILRRRTHPEDFAHITPLLEASLDPNIRRRQSYRYRIARADTGEERWLQAYGEATFGDRDGSAQPISYTGTLQDVTDQVAKENDLKEDRARLELALEAGNLAVWELNLATGVVTPSAELNELYRLPRDAKPSLEDFRKCYAPGESERIEAEWAPRFERGETAMDFEAKNVWPDGIVKWIAVRATVLRDDQGKPKRLLGVATDVTQRRSYEEHLVTTTQELQHRIKNTLAIVQTLASQTLRAGKPMDESLSDLNGRLQALARSNDLITGRASSGASVAQLVADITKPYRPAGEQGRFTFSGPEVRLSDKDAVSLGMALHELCTNAVKHGALYSEHGRVAVEWRVSDEGLMLTWSELGGPAVIRPTKSGLGTRLLTRGLFQPPHGRVVLEFKSTGVICHVAIALASQSDEESEQGRLL
jgi:two-component sensor histidine kinase